MELTLSEVVQYGRDIGATTVLFLALIGGYKRWYVWGWQYDEKCKECDRWQRIAVPAVDMTAQALSGAATRTERGA